MRLNIEETANVLVKKTNLSTTSNQGSTASRFTGRVGAKKMSFMVDGSLHKAWYTTLTTTDGEKVHIKDRESPMGMVKADTRYKAIKVGENFIERNAHLVYPPA